MIGRAFPWSGDRGGLKAAVINDTPKVMTDGNWRFGMFVDGRVEKLMMVWRDVRLDVGLAKLEAERGDPRVGAGR